MFDGIVSIKPGRDKPVRNQHPWVFSGAIDRTDHAHPGDLVTILDSNGDFLGQGYYNPRSQIQVRLLTWQDTPIDDVWWQARIAGAVQQRIRPHDNSIADGQRLIHAENDFLPGLVVDYYAGWVVLQALTLYIDQNKNRLAGMIAEVLRQRGIAVYGVYERSDVDVRRREGLDEITGVLWGQAPPDRVVIEEGSEKLYVDVYRGHKTGLYLDQTVNRQILTTLMGELVNVAQTRLLNLFSYTGAFGVRAVYDDKRQHVTNVDTSAEALKIAEENAALNGLDEEAFAYVQADVFDYLRQQHDANQTYHVVVLDPPKFAHNKRQIERASRGYKDINLNALRIVEPGGYLMTFSCSGAISPDLFQKIVFGALADSGRQAQIVQFLHAAPDHPVALTFPEGEYLKGLLLRVF